MFYVPLNTGLIYLKKFPECSVSELFLLEIREKDGVLKDSV